MHAYTGWFEAVRQCIHFDLVTFDNDYIISHQKNWQLEWRTRSACIFEAHAPADIEKHTYSIPPHGVSQWANAHMTIGERWSDATAEGRKQTSRIGIKCVAKCWLLLSFFVLFLFCFVVWLILLLFSNKTNQVMVFALKTHCHKVTK